MKKSKKKPEAITTFLGEGANIEGTIEFKGTIRIDGNVQGKILSDGGTVIIGEKAVIKADINVDTAIILGQVNGLVEAVNSIEVRPPGSVIGDIQAPVISIDAGVRFDGNCAMKKPNGYVEPKMEIDEKNAKSNGSKIKNFPKNL